MAANASLHKQHLILAGETWQPWFYIHEEDGRTTTYSGVMWDVLLHLAKVTLKKWHQKNSLARCLYVNIFIFVFHTETFLSGVRIHI